MVTLLKPTLKAIRETARTPASHFTYFTCCNKTNILFNLNALKSHLVYHISVFLSICAIYIIFFMIMKNPLFHPINSFPKHFCKPSIFLFHLPLYQPNGRLQICPPCWPQASLGQILFPKPTAQRGTWVSL